MFKNLIVLSFVLLSLSLTGRNASASGYQTVEDSSPQDVVDSMAAKGVRGAANLVTGWVELPKQIYLTGERDGWLRGAVIGPLKGIGMTVVRTVSGAGELLTFFVPYPGFFDPWFEPRFVWQKE
jgi:putative exosortase-associated protein (TIGR04073 family)